MSLQLGDTVRSDDGELFGVVHYQFKNSSKWLVVLEDTEALTIVLERELVLVCPFCPNADVDSDYRACPVCKEVI